MPTYEIDVGGKTHEIESDSPLSDAQLGEYARSLTAPAKIEASQPAAAAPGPRARLPGTLSEQATAIKKGLWGLGEAATTLASGAVAGPLSGAAGVVGGLYGLARGDSAAQAAGGAAEVQRSLQEKLTYSPRSEEGQVAVSALGYPMQKAGELLGQAGGVVGEKLGNRALGEVIGERTPELLASVLGARGLAKSIGPMRAAKPLTQSQEAIQASQAKGFMADPLEARPSAANVAVEGMANRSVVQNRIAAKNAEHAAGLAKRDLGLPKDARLDTPTLDSLRGAAGQKYETIKQLAVDVLPDAQYLQAIRDLDKRFESMKEFAPALYNHPALERARGALSQPQSPAHPGAWTPKSLLEISQTLRERANRMLKARDVSDEAFNEATALKAGATAMEDLLERHLVPPGVQRVGTNFRLVSDFRKARQLIAKTYDVEAAINPVTGAIDPQKLRRIAEKGGRLTGGLKDIADAAAAMPSVMKSVEGADTSLAPHIGDWGAAGAISMATGHPQALAAAAVRPTATALASSRRYQNAMGRVRPNKPTRQYSLKDALSGAAAESLGTQDETADR